MISLRGLRLSLIGLKCMPISTAVFLPRLHQLHRIKEEREAFQVILTNHRVEQNSIVSDLLRDQELTVF
jgi:hypothetical protein